LSGYGPLLFLNTPKVFLRGVLLFISTITPKSDIHLLTCPVYKLQLNT